MDSTLPVRSFRGAASSRLLGAAAVTLLLAPLMSGALTRLSLFQRDEVVPVSHPRELLPAGLVAYAELDQLGRIAREMPGSALWQRIQAMDVYQTYRKSPEYTKLVGGIAFVQLVTGKPIEEALGQVLGERICIGVKEREGQKDPGLVAVVTAESDAVAEEVMKSLDRIAQLSPDNKMRHATVRGIDVYLPDDKLEIARVAKYLLVTNDPDLMHAVIGRAFGEGESFANSALCAAFSTDRPQAATASLIIDSALLHRASGKARWLPDRLDNAGASLLLQDVMEAAARSPNLKLHLIANADGVTLQLPIAVAPDQLPEQFRCFVHAKARAESLELLSGAECLASMSEWRDVPQFWKDRKKLLIEDTERGFAEFDSGLAVFFGGRVLSEDLIPELCDDYLFVGARQTYDRESSPPKARFPSGAWIFRMKNAEKWGGELASAFHTLIGVVNADRGQKRQTPMLMFTDTCEGVTIYGARFLPNDDRPTDLGRYNFSPAMARVGDRIVVSTADELMRDVIHQLLRGGLEKLPPGTLTHVRAYGAATHRILVDNRDALIAQSMLEKGKSLEQASLEFDGLCAIVAALDRVDLSSRCDERGFELELKARLAPFTPVASAAGAASSSSEGGSR